MFAVSNSSNLLRERLEKLRGMTHDEETAEVTNTGWSPS